ncbi:MAG: nucleotidyltransferase family protein [Candidatus Odinarchaeia archaeon]
MKAFVLAAGVGTRLQPYTSLIPKPLLPVGGTPCIRYILNRLIRQGFEDVVICVNDSHLSMFKHELRDLDISFSTSSKPLGSAGEIFNCRDLIDDDFLIYYADELTDINLKKLVDFHNTKKDGLATLALVDQFPLPVGLINLNGSEVQSIEEKPSINIPFWVGIAILRKEILEYMSLGDDFARDIFPQVLEEERKIYAKIFETEWIDIGNISRYRHANELAKKRLLI